MDTESKRVRRPSYRRYMKSKHWENLRDRKIQQTPSCYHCGSWSKLHVHHIDYKNFTDCTLDDLLVLCGKHHDIFHEALMLKGGKPKDYPPAAVSRLIEWFNFAPESEKKLLKSERKKLIKSTRSEAKSKRRRFSRSVRKVIHQCQRGGYSISAVTTLRDSLTDLLGGKAITEDLTDLILDYSAGL